jgi:hypothetical protein
MIGENYQKFDFQQISSTRRIVKLDAQLVINSARSPLALQPHKLPITPFSDSLNADGPRANVLDRGTSFTAHGFGLRVG